MRNDPPIEVVWSPVPDPSSHALRKAFAFIFDKLNEPAQSPGNPQIQLTKPAGELELQRKQDP
jgi:hypothetical protein